MANRKVKVCILYGGKSGEHEVSLRSAATVLRSIDHDRYEPLLIGITPEGKWYLQDSTGAAAAADGKAGDGGEQLTIHTDKDHLVSVVPEQGFSSARGALDIDFVFPVLHGTCGEDGTVQGLLEIAGIPYAGSGVLGSALGMDKITMKEVWRSRGLPVVAYTMLTREETLSPGFDMTRFSDTVFSELGPVLFIKPSRAGSSVGVHRVTHPAELKAGLDDAFRYCPDVLIEKEIRGRELEVAVMEMSEGDQTKPKASPPGEILPASGFYDYQSKYIDPDGAALVIPAKMDGNSDRLIKQLACEAFTAASASGFARVDFLMDGSDGQLYLNEINTIPGFTRISMFPKLFESTGISYTGIVTRIIERGFEQFALNRELSYSYFPTSD